MKVEASVVIAKRRDRVWRRIRDIDTYDGFLAGIILWQRIRGEGGLGSRYRVRMQVGSTPVGGEIEVVEYERGYEVAWTGVTGIEQRGRIRLRDAPGGTEVTFRLNYGVPGGGILGFLADRLSAPMVAANVRESLGRLRELVEAPQPARATRRRPATARRRPAPRRRSSPAR
jgi:uncharacterized membrane protein